MTRAAIVVVGGNARRLNGIAKPWLLINGRHIIDRIVDAVLPQVQQCVLVGEPPAGWARADVQWAREEPIGGGPVAALTAGLGLLDAAIDEVLLLAGDTPFIDEPLSALLATTVTDDGVVVTSDGQVQYLCALLRTASIHRALAQAGSSMRSLYECLSVTTVEALVDDADTWEDVARLRQETTTMNEWLTTVCEKLGIDPVIDTDALLELARDVAHHTERKNAPLTSYLLGYAAANKSLSAAQLAELAAELGRLAKERA